MLSRQRAPFCVWGSQGRKISRPYPADIQEAQRQDKAECTGQLSAKHLALPFPPCPLSHQGQGRTLPLVGHERQAYAVDWRAGTSSSPEEGPRATGQCERQAGHLGAAAIISFIAKIYIYGWHVEKYRHACHREFRKQKKMARRNHL